jgi:hypothetical protein
VHHGGLVGPAPEVRIRLGFVHVEVRIRVVEVDEAAAVRHAVVGGRLGLRGVVPLGQGVVQGQVGVDTSGDGLDEQEVLLPGDVAIRRLRHRVVPEANAARPGVDDEALDESDRVIEGDAVQLAEHADGVGRPVVADASVVGPDGQLSPLNVEEIGDGCANAVRAARVDLAQDGRDVGGQIPAARELDKPQRAVRAVDGDVVGEWAWCIFSVVQAHPRRLVDTPRARAVKVRTRIAHVREVGDLGPSDGRLFVEAERRHHTGDCRQNRRERNGERREEDGCPDGMAAG